MICLGLIAGTSADGIDAAIIDCNTRATKLISCLSTPYQTPLRARILRARSKHAIAVEELGSLDLAIADAFAATALALLERNGLKPKDIRALGSHGQTIRHRPDLSTPFSLQLGNPSRLAQQTGIDVVADFRAKDIANGGQGAPLVPLFHQALFAIPTETRGILNLGGIANLSLLDKQTDQPKLGFDTGPANTLLDAWYEHHHEGQYDNQGQWAAGGTVDSLLLSELLAEPYFRESPPKSTGQELFRLEWLPKRIQDLSPQDVQATLLELTALTIRDALRNWMPGCQRLLVCGGGVHNITLIRRLRALIEIPIEATSAYGIDPDCVEAAAFGWLASRCLAGLSGNAPAATGAKAKCILGGIYQAG